MQMGGSQMYDKMKKDLENGWMNPDRACQRVQHSQFFRPAENEKKKRPP